MSKCLKSIPGYDSKIQAPRMGFDIDRGVKETDKPEDAQEAVKQFYEAFNTLGYSLVEDFSYKNREEAVSALGSTIEQANERRDFFKVPKSRPTQTEDVRELASRNLANPDDVSESEVIDAAIQSAKERGVQPKLYTELPPVPEYEDIIMMHGRPQAGVLDTGDGPKGYKLKKLIKGLPVVSRLDIPMYDRYGKWVVTVHKPNTVKKDGKTRPGDVIGYGKTAHLKDVTFDYSDFTQSNAMQVMSGKGKRPFAAFGGKWQPTKTTDVIKKAETLFNNPEWTQVGMNPELMGQYFYNRETLEPVVRADEVYQIGQLLFAKNVKYLRKNIIKKADAERRSSVKMSPTEGVLMLKNTEMATPLDNFSRGNRDTKQVHNMLSENNILHRINKDGSITAFIEVGNGQYKVIKGLRTFEDVAKEIGIPNPYEESLLYP